jgi:prevent-host-death family protein
MVVMLCATRARYVKPISWPEVEAKSLRAKSCSRAQSVKDWPSNCSTSMMMDMKSIGLFEAKTKLSEICERVAAKGEPVTVTRRGKPLVTIQPIQTGKDKRKSVWDVRADYEKKHGSFKDDFKLPPREKQKWQSICEAEQPSGDRA